MSTALRYSLCLLLGVCALVLVACGGGDDENGVATLSVIVSGLPAGTPADVTVTGPAGYRQTLGQSITLGNLVAGTYTITSARVMVGSSSFRAQQPVQTAIVAAGAAPVVGIIYAAPG